MVLSLRYGAMQYFHQHLAYHFGNNIPTLIFKVIIKEKLLGVKLHISKKIGSIFLLFIQHEKYFYICSEKESAYIISTAVTEA